MGLETLPDEPGTGVVIVDDSDLNYTVNSGALVSSVTDVPAVYLSTNGTLAFTNNGTIRSDGGGKYDVSAIVASDDHYNPGLVTNHGAIDVTAEGTFTAWGFFSGAWGPAIDNAGSVTVHSDWLAFGDVNYSSFLDTRIDSHFTNEVGATFDVEGGLGTGDGEARGFWFPNGGALTNGGVITVASDGEATGILGYWAGTITNTGSIVATSYGTQADSQSIAIDVSQITASPIISPYGNWVITNSGTITAQTAINEFQDNPGETPTLSAMEIINSGHINGNINAGYGNDTIFNTGTIRGVIDLGDQNDLLDSRGGTVDGLIMAGVGDDVVYGGDGNDSILGSGSGFTGSDRDYLNGGEGNDHIDGDEGFENGQTGADDGKFDDTLLGGAGNDKLFGEYGNDVIDGGAGSDQIHGGGGDDTVSYADATGSVHVNLAVTVAQSVGGGEGTDTLVYKFVSAGDIDAIENLSGSSYSDQLTGNAAGNVLSGQAGDDILAGGGGNDVLDGGDGSDTASYAAESAGVTISLGVKTAQAVGSGSTTLVSVENLTGSDFADVLTGNTGNNVLSGGAGNDTLNPGSGDDTVRGGDGDDKITLSASFSVNDKIDGGAGNDTVILNGDYSAGLVFKSVQLTGVETLSLTGAHSYNLTVNDANVAAGAVLTVNAAKLGPGDSLVFHGGHETDGSFAITGGQGSDTLSGGGGNDVIAGGGGADHLTGAGGIDHFVYKAAADSSGAAFDTVTGFNVGADLFDVPFLVKHLNAPVTGGSLSAASFDADLTAAVGVAQLGAHHAVLFTAAAGSYAGDTFLIVDMNNAAGYQAGQDLVVLLDGAAHLSSLTAASFI